MIDWNTAETETERRQTAKCKCGSVKSRLVKMTVRVTTRSDMAMPMRSVRVHGSRETCACGRELSFHVVKGVYRADKTCDSRCINSKGHLCECSCGGANHGAGYA